MGNITTFGVSIGIPLMKFTLTYDGPLSSNNGNHKFQKKWKIREHIQPQLADLWRTHPCLKNLVRYVPKEQTYGWAESHHSNVPVTRAPGEFKIPEIDLGAPIDVGGIGFLPLIRDSYALVCSLNIIFMRKEQPGKVYQGGDLDNRIKSLIDGLKVPKDDIDNVRNIRDKPAQPVFCLLEDDGLITKLSVETSRLLTAPEQDTNYVRLIIEVSVAVTQPRMYNQIFLGG
jgi:hypothetical protein